MKAEHDLHQRWARRTRDPSFFALFLLGVALIAATLIPAAREKISGELGQRLLQFLLGQTWLRRGP